MKPILTSAIALAVAVSGAAGVARAHTVDIRLGYQEMCTDTYPAGTVIMGLHLLERYLPKNGVHYHIVWRNYDSGAPLTNMMLANKLDFGTMGDYPLVVNGAKFQATHSERSFLITMTAYNAVGAGNGIVVPVKSNVYSVNELEGKKLSVPVGSSAWGMLYEMAADRGIPFHKFRLVNQPPMVGIAAIAEDKIAAHADFCPMSEYMQYKGTGRMIYSGAQTGVPYLHGAVVRAAYAKAHPEVVVAYCKAVTAADIWIKKDPKHAATMMAKWTMIPKEVLYLYYSHGGYLTPDPTIKPMWRKVLNRDHALLAKYAGIPPLKINAWVNSQYLRTAFKQMGLHYDQQEKTILYPKRNIARPPEIWMADNHMEKFHSVAAMLRAFKKQTAAGNKINATYVYDANTGLKMFGNCAFYVKSSKGYCAYMTVGAAKRAATAAKTASMSFAAAVAGMAK